MKSWKCFGFVLLAVFVGVGVAVYRISAVEHSRAFFE